MTTTNPIASTSIFPSVVTKSYKPYFTDQELSLLTEKQRGKLSSARVERGRQAACTFIDAVCGRMGFPRRTTATAMMLYHRFHIFFPLKDFNYIEVSLACIYVSSKLHDTLKKPRDLLLQSYPIRYPTIFPLSSPIVDPSKLPSNQLEQDKRKISSLERLVLETIAFDLGVGREVGWGMEGLVGRLGRGLGLSKEMMRLAWRMLADVYRTIAPLQYPPHALLLSSIYTSALLTLPPPPSSIMSVAPGKDLDDTDATLALKQEAERVVKYFSEGGVWEEAFGSDVNEVDAIAHHLIDMFIILLTIPTGDPSITTSSFSPSSPSELPLGLSTSSSNNNLPNGNISASMLNSGGQSQHQLPTAFQLGSLWNPQTLTQLKISLRESRPGRSHSALPGSISKDQKKSTSSSLETKEASLTDVILTDSERGKDIAKGRNAAEIWGGLNEGLGKNDATIRFLFD